MPGLNQIFNKEEEFFADEESSLIDFFDDEDQEIESLNRLANDVMPDNPRGLRHLLRNKNVVDPGHKHVKDYGYSKVLGSTIVISNDDSEITLLTDTLPGGRLGTDRTIYFKFYVEFNNSTAGSDTLVIKLKYAGTTTTLTLTTNDTGGLMDGVIEGTLEARAATNAQDSTVLVRGSAAGGATNLFAISEFAAGSFAIDSTADQTLAVTATLGSASADLTLTVYNGFFVLI